MGSPILIVSICMGKSTEIQRVKQYNIIYMRRQTIGYVWTEKSLFSLGIPKYMLCVHMVLSIINFKSPCDS